MTYIGSTQLAKIARCSYRQLQWLDEGEILSPLKMNHRRLYSNSQVRSVAAISKLRRKGVSLQRLRRFAPWILRLCEKWPDFWLVVTRRQIVVALSGVDVISMGVQADSPIIVVQVKEIVCV